MTKAITYLNKLVEDRHSLCFATLILPMQYTQYLRLFTEWAMPDPVVSK